VKLRLFIIPVCFFVLISFVYAEVKIDMGPQLDLCYGSTSNCNVPTDIEKISREENLYFKISLINDGSAGWICFNHWRYTLEYQHEDEESKTEGTNNVYNPNNKDDSINYCIPPNEKFTFYLPFEYYNSMKEDGRIHMWTITPKVSLEKVTCFGDSSFKKEISCTGAEMEGNRIKFESVKELPTTNLKLDGVWNWIKKGYNVVYAILIFLVALFAVIFGFKKLFK